MCPGDDKYSGKCCSTAVEEGNDLVEARSFEVPIEDSGADNGRQIEQYKLCWYDDLCAR
jgi:hypothetical protein